MIEDCRLHESDAPIGANMEDLGMQMVAVCREVNKGTGEIAVYPLKGEVTSRLLFCLGLRARANPELRYFVILKSTWETQGGRQGLSKFLKKRTLNKSHLDAIGSIQEL